MDASAKKAALWNQLGALEGALASKLTHHTADLALPSPQSFAGTSIISRCVDVVMALTSSLRSVPEEAMATLGTALLALNPAVVRRI